MGMELIIFLSLMGAVTAGTGIGALLSSRGEYSEPEVPLLGAAPEHKVCPSSCPRCAGGTSTESYMVLYDHHVPYTYAQNDFQILKKPIDRQLRRHKGIIGDWRKINRHILSAERVFTERRLSLCEESLQAFDRNEVTDNEWEKLCELYYERVQSLIESHISYQQKLYGITHRNGVIESIRNFQEQRLIGAPKLVKTADWDNVVRQIERNARVT